MGYRNVRVPQTYTGIGSPVTQSTKTVPFPVAQRSQASRAMRQNGIVPPKGGESNVAVAPMAQPSFYWSPSSADPSQTHVASGKPTLY